MVNLLWSLKGSWVRDGRSVKRDSYSGAANTIGPLRAQCAEQMLAMLVTSDILGLCVLILNSRAAKLISQLIGCVFRFHDSIFPFSAFISELYFNHICRFESVCVLYDV